MNRTLPVPPPAPSDAGTGIRRLVLYLAASLALPSLAGARVFQCEVDGQLVFQDKSCDGLAAPDSGPGAEGGAAGPDSSPAPTTTDAAPGSPGEPGVVSDAATGGDAAEARIQARMEEIAVQAFEALRVGNVQAYLRLCTCPGGLDTGTPAGSNQITLTLPQDHLEDARGMVEDIRQQGLTIAGKAVTYGRTLIIPLDARQRVLDRPARVIPLFDWREDDEPCLVRIERMGLAGAAE